MMRFLQNAAVALAATALLPVSSCPVFAGSPVELLKKLVEQNSGTKNSAGVDAVQTILEREFAALGFVTERVRPRPGDKTGGMLAAYMKGKSRKTVTFVAHADTVFEPSSGFLDFKVSSDNAVAYGPGVIDDKGSIVVALEGIRLYLAGRKRPEVSLRFVVAPAEETENPPFVMEAFRRLSRDSFLVLGLEPALDNGNIVSSRRGDRWYRVSVRGREAHSGRSHRHGVNACLELADKISRISALTDYARNVTVSVGRMEGGQDKYNIVCGSASAKIDTRFATLADRETLQAEIDKILRTPKVLAADDGLAAETSVEIESDAPPFAKQPAADSYLKSYLEIVSRVEGRPLSHELSGGVADTNAFAREGLPILDGLGAEGGKMHTKEEFVRLGSLETRARALAEFLAGLPR